MKKEPMTLEKLKALKPSDDNVIVLERIEKKGVAYDELTFRSSYVTSNNYLLSLAKDGYSYSLNPIRLREYYHKQERKTIELTEVMDIYGALFFVDSQGRRPDFKNSRMSDGIIDRMINLPNARKILIDAETFEVIDE